MFPYIYLSENFYISTFWVSITISFFWFIWMLNKLSKRFNYDFGIFKNNLLWFFISVFTFSRIFSIISNWQEEKYIENFMWFFITRNYNFSLMWAIFWFFLVLFILLKLRKEKLENYINWIALSLLFILPIWFFWALLWWQVFWIVTNLWIEIEYDISKDIPVIYTNPVFPLPIVYAIIFFLTFSTSYVLSMYVKYKWLLWYLAFMVFACIVFIFEFFNWRINITSIFWLNLAQYWSIVIFIYFAYRLKKISK